MLQNTRGKIEKVPTGNYQIKCCSLSHSYHKQKLEKSRFQEIHRKNQMSKDLLLVSTLTCWDRKDRVFNHSFQELHLKLVLGNDFPLTVQTFTNSVREKPLLLLNGRSKERVSEAPLDRANTTSNRQGIAVRKKTNQDFSSKEA